MPLTPNIGTLSQTAIKSTKQLLRFVERLDTSERELSPESLIALTREISQRAHNLQLLSSSIRFSTKQTIRVRRQAEARKPKGFHWPAIAEAGKEGVHV